MGDAKERLAEYSQLIREKVDSGLDSAYFRVLSQPKTTFIFLAILSLWLGNIGTNFQDQIVDDVEVFLPEGAESTDLLLEVREEWSTDVAFIYIKTPNAEDPDIFGEEYNITSVSVLHEISWIEGDDEKEHPDLNRTGWTGTKKTTVRTTVFCGSFRYLKSSRKLIPATVGLTVQCVKTPARD